MEFNIDPKDPTNFWIDENKFVSHNAEETLIIIDKKNNIKTMRQLQASHLVQQKKDKKHLIYPKEILNLERNIVSVGIWILAASLFLDNQVQKNEPCLFLKYFQWRQTQKEVKKNGLTGHYNKQSIPRLLFYTHFFHLLKECNPFLIENNYYTSFLETDKTTQNNFSYDTLCTITNDKKNRIIKISYHQKNPDINRNIEEDEWTIKKENNEIVHIDIKGKVDERINYVRSKKAIEARIPRKGEIIFSYAEMSNFLELNNEEPTTIKAKTVFQFVESDYLRTLLHIKFLEGLPSSTLNEYFDFLKKDGNADKPLHCFLQTSRTGWWYHFSYENNKAALYRAKNHIASRHIPVDISQNLWMSPIDALVLLRCIEKEKIVPKQVINNLQINSTYYTEVPGQEDWYVNLNYEFFPSVKYTTIEF